MLTRWSTTRLRPTRTARWARPLLDEIVRDGPRAMLAAMLHAEITAYIDATRVRSTRARLIRRPHVVSKPMHAMLC